MSSVLKLDGRTAKGKRWKEYLDSGQKLKQGILISSKLCSHCNTYPDIKAETVKCMSCGDLYHCPCILSPLNLDHVKDISENPSLLWCCLDCLSLKNDNDRSTSANPGNEFIRKSDLEHLMRFVGNAVSKLKTDIVNHVDSKIESAICENMPPSHSVAVAKQNDNTVLIDEANIISTFADVAKTIPLNSNVTRRNTALPQATTENTARQNALSHMHFKYDNSNNIVILKPKEGKQIKPCDETIKMINSSVQGLGIDYCRPRQSGAIALKVLMKIAKLKLLNA